jgi:gliding motility-associated-like protein
MKRILQVFSIIIITASAIGQTTTIPYATTYETTGQNLWKQGTAGIFQLDHVFFNQSWNNSTTFGPITNIAGFQFGARITAGTWGEIGSGLQINFGTEQVDITYASTTNIIKPQDETYHAGDQININTNFQPIAPPASDIVADEYDVNFRLWLKFGMGINISAQVCVFSCTNFNIINLNLPVDTFDIVYISNTTGISLLDGLYEWPVGDYFPLEYQDDKEIITINFDFPSNAGASVFLQNKNLVSFLNPQSYDSTYFNVYFSIPKFIGALNIPYVSAVFANLSNSWTAGPFYLNYILMEAGFNLGLFHKQRLTLQPTMKGKFNLPTKVDYALINPANNAVILQGYDSIINYTVGNRIRINYPCNYTEMDVIPSFNMENQFTNHTYDSIALDFVFKMLQFSMGMNPVTVIPAFCVDVPYPCPTWNKPWKWCSRRVCTPALVFPGFNVGFGPLIHWQPNLFNIKYNWCNNSWEMQGFNTFDSLATFTLLPRRMSVAVTHNTILCHGNLTGSATAHVTHGRPPYTYQWSNGVVVNTSAQTNTQNGLGAGTHYVYVTDANGCQVFEGFFIIQPDMPLAFNDLTSNPTCFDSFDGTISTGVSGGTPLYSYNWSHGASTPNATGLDAGTYSVTVTDNNGCVLSKTWTLTKPDDIIISIQKQDVLCHGDNTGWIISEIQGGVAPYTYNWSNGATSAINLNLAADTYTLTVTDFNGCFKTTNIDILEPASPLSTTFSISDVQCYGNSDGSISTNTTGGTPSYSYEWYDANNIILNNFSSSLNNIPVGNYTLIVTDANNCQNTLNFTVQQPDPLVHEFIVEDVLCFGHSTGSIQMNLSGATPPFTYAWSEGSSTQNISNLPAGSYTVTVTDDNGCIYILDTSIGQPAAELTTYTNVTDVRCWGDSTGHVEAISQGGTAPYSFLWSTGATTSSIHYVPAGTYTLTVTDNNGCISYSGGTVNQPELPVTVDAVVSPALCHGSEDGSVDLTVYGGTLPYTLTWDDNSYIMQTNQQRIYNLGAGVFNFTITDGNNCSSYHSYVINQPDAAVIDFTTTLVSCFNGNDGTATPSIVGGTPAYTYQWSNGSTTEVLSGVNAGTYLLTISDQNNCQYFATVEIGTYPEIIAIAEITQVSCKDLSDASIHIIVAGGTGNYTFNWSNGATSQNLDNIGPGDYTLTISDENLCQLVLEFIIEQATNECMRIPSSFTPNGDGINDTWVLGNIDAYPAATVQIFNKWGNLLYETKGQYIPWNGKWNGNPMPSETYYYIIELNNGDKPYTGPVTIIR